MKKIFLVVSSCMFLLLGCKNEPQKKEQKIIPAVSNSQEKTRKLSLVIQPIRHASMLLTVNGKSIYVDPVGEKKLYEGKQTADLILLTDIHSDHFKIDILKILMKDSTKIIAPKAVAKQLPEWFREKTTVLENGKSVTMSGINIEAIPMYNLREEAKKFHPKGRGNGYLLDTGKTRIYIAGDTGPIPEMRTLKNIDIAFIPMNLPYTMPVSMAADAVLDFKPTKVYPYHYLGKNGLADVAEFKNIITTNSSEIEVVQLDWYPNR